MQQNTVLQLTVMLRENWQEKEKKLSEELVPLKEHIRTKSSPEQWQKIQDIIANMFRETSAKLKEKKTGQRKDGIQGTLAQKRTL